MELKEQIHVWMKKNEGELFRMLQSMVREPSIQANEAGIQLLTKGWLEEVGFEVDMWEPGGELFIHEAFLSARDSFAGSPNVVGVKKGNGFGRSLVLNGHVDVVREGDSDDWHTDPFSGEIKDGKLYGRGATDMKGGNAAMLFALQALHDLNIVCEGDIIFHSVIEEESGGAGTLAAILRGYAGDAALIPEPTQMKIFPKQQGSLWFRLHIKGASAHGGTPYRGVNAIEKAMAVFLSLKELEKIRNDRVSDPLYEEVPIPLPINVGVVEGGDWPSSVPDLVKLEGRYGVGPDETVEAAQAEFEAWIAGLGKKDNWFAAHPVKLEWFGARWLPGAIDTDHPLMNILTKNYEKVMGEIPAVEASPWGTDGGLLTAVGNTPTIVFGPGITSLAHFANEYVELDKVRSCAEIIAYTILEWCSGINKEAEE
ncbi:acetylornithine deacetylase [Evansella caseinilytica]|uniref:Acetylornithine deacetylase n=1 Tax=Evansella caseinilytica TaxID=1503961 RepID=A0A1H3NMB9_9BACI|nr:peptidase [Evansella caseinilytica]SDY89903.1 acetylornithine deacetylase [Evansella caseinilytica]